MLELERDCLRLANLIVQADALEVRDLEAGEKPFLYASGNWGPGYVSIKGLVTQRELFMRLVDALRSKLMLGEVYLDFVAGNVTGGMIPGWVLSEMLDVPFVYVRGTRKKGGQREMVTGAGHLPCGARGLVVEELVNFAETTCNSAAALRDRGFIVEDAATILSYNNPEALAKLFAAQLGLTHLLTLDTLLKAAERHGTFSVRAIQDYREFLRDPLAWQAARGLIPDKEGGTL